MKIVFRVDSSLNIGTGHLMRCLALAKKFDKKDKIYFICRDLPGNINNLIKKEGYFLKILPEIQILNNKLQNKTLEVDATKTKKILEQINPEILVIDSYVIDEKWEKIVRPAVNRIIVIDDLANRKHDCDILIDQNYYKNMDSRYDGLVSNTCVKLLGPRYVILREEFYEFKKKLCRNNRKIRNIFIFFGGIDINNDTGKVLEALSAMKIKDIIINVVVGEKNTKRKEIEKICNESNFKFHCQVNNMAQLMFEADLAIGCGGITTWERCFLALPSLVVVSAENQRESLKDCYNEGDFLILIGESSNITKEKIISSVEEIFNKPELYKKMIKKCVNLFKGKSENIIDIIKKKYNNLEHKIELKDFSTDNIRQTYFWVKQKRHKKNFMSEGKVTIRGNKEYWYTALNNKRNKVYAVFLEKQYIGNCGYKNINDNIGELWIYIGIESLQGKGIGIKILHKLLWLGFNFLNLSKIVLNVARYNVAAIKIYQKAGFEIRNKSSIEWENRDTFFMELQKEKYKTTN